MARTFLLIAAISGLLAVMLGAFGAHGLKAKVTPELLAIYQTGVQYQFYHTLSLCLVGLLALHYPQAKALAWSGWLMIAGITIFSGSLYLLTLTEARWLGAITPIGGVAFIAGWTLLAWAILKNVGK